MKCACIETFCAALRQAYQASTGGRVEHVSCANEVVPFAAGARTALQVPFFVDINDGGSTGRTTALVTASFCPFCGTPTARHDAALAAQVMA